MKKHGGSVGHNLRRPRAQCSTLCIPARCFGALTTRHFQRGVVSASAASAQPPEADARKTSRQRPSDAGPRRIDSTCIRGVTATEALDNE